MQNNNIRGRENNRPSVSWTSSVSHSDNRMSLREREKYAESFNFPYCNLTTKYEKLAKIGQGTFGEVFKAKDKMNPTKFVALKKVLTDNEREGFPITTLREIRILQILKHENVVNFIEICRTEPSRHNNYRSSFYLVFEFCEHDLAGLLANSHVKFTLGEIKKVIQQLLNGLYFIHYSNILHRDLKAANILITKDGVLKLADFGLARAYSNNERPRCFTNQVVTLWYRPPELLLGATNYGPSVDVWSAGCIMAEMWIRSPIMQGSSEQHQLILISQLCGSITPDVWPGVENLELYKQIRLPQKEKRKVKERLMPHLKDAHAADLLDKLLSLDPSKRVDTDVALNHDFFWTDPMPCDLKNMMANHTHSMFEYLATQRRHHSMPPRPTTSALNEDGGYQDRIY